ncbi:hypothetical protein TNCV_1684801 [Trichonephila clavipes]|nr:hypothetical protein TNCV_1684801 [Trichonephila clavipes]
MVLKAAANDMRTSRPFSIMDFVCLDLTQSGSGCKIEQLTDFDRGRIISEKQVGRIDVSLPPSVGIYMVVARCWQQWITEGRVYRRGGSGRPRNTNDREDLCNQKSGHFGTNNVASIDSTPLTFPDIQCHQEKP